MSSLEGEPMQQWNGHFNSNDLSSITFDFFKKYLQDLVADFINRRLTVYENWESARQKQD